MFGKSGKQYFNPKVAEAHGDGPEEGHPEIHHHEIHPHGPTSEHPHHSEIHYHDGREPLVTQHANHDEASEHVKSHTDGIATDEKPMDEGEEGMEEKISPGIHKAVARRADSGAF